MSLDSEARSAEFHFLIMSVLLNDLMVMNIAWLYVETSHKVKDESGSIEWHVHASPT